MAKGPRTGTRGLQASSDGVFGRDFGLRNQIRRAAVSVMSNVAEGFARRGDRDFAHFLDIARGSAVECQSLAYVALDVGYINEEVFGRLYQIAEEAASLISGFAYYLRKSI